jgi:hypothetical protein
MGNTLTGVSSAPAGRQVVLLDATEHVDTALQIQIQATKRPMLQTIPRTTFPFGQGITQMTKRFLPGIGSQSGLDYWEPVQPSIAVSKDTEWDSTVWNPQRVYHGWEEVHSQLFRKALFSAPIAVSDVVWLSDYSEQLSLIYGQFADITLDEWENAISEYYANYASANGRYFVLTDGAFNSVSATYDPFTKDSDGDVVITIPSGTKLSTLSYKPLHYLAEELALACPAAAISNDGGIERTGLVIDMQEWQNMIARDPALRQDYRDFSAKILIEHYSKIDSFRDLAFLNHLRCPRFVIKKDDGTTMTLKRVNPKVETTTGLLDGVKYTVNPEYLTAEIKAAYVILKDSVEFQVPAAYPTTPGGMTTFGVSAGFNGTFEFLSLQDAVTDMWGEKGVFAGRLQTHPKPLIHKEWIAMVLYASCPQCNRQVCDISSDAAASSTAVGLGSDAASTAVDSTNNKVTLTLEKPLYCGLSSAITLVDDDSTSYTGIVAEASSPPTYTFALTTAPATYDKYTAAGATTVTCS